MEIVYVTTNIDSDVELAKYDWWGSAGVIYHSGNVHNGRRIQIIRGRGQMNGVYYWGIQGPPFR